MPLVRKEIERLHAAVLAARLDRDELLAFVDGRVKSELPRFANESEQLLSDLHELNRIEGPAGGRTPLVDWLEAAIILVGPRSEAVLFEEAWKELGGRTGAAVVPDSPRSPDVPRGGARESSPTADREDVRLYVAFAPQDTRFVEHLEHHLTAMSGSYLRIWHRGKVRPGELLEIRNSAEVAAADLAIVFLSPHALASEPTVSDLDALTTRMGVDWLRVVPVLARDCAWENSEFGLLNVLPHDGRPISARRNASEAYREIARTILAIVQDARDDKQRDAARARHAVDSPQDDQRGRPGSKGLDARTSEDGPLLGTPIEQIFTRHGTPQLTYVRPDQHHRIHLALRTLGRGLVVEGPTQIGKTTVVRKALAGVAFRMIDCRRPRFRDQIETLLKQWNQEDEWHLDGHVVIDDAHLIPRDLLGDLARFMRSLADEPEPTGKITLVGINKIGRRLVADQRDLAGRIDEIRMLRQPSEKLRELIERGEILANVLFRRREEMVHEARGSFRLAQELCFLAASHAPSGESPPPMEVVSAQRRIAAGPGEVREQMRDALGTELDGPLFDFVCADRDKPSPAEATPGACLALLWVLAVGEGMRAPIGEAKRTYPALAPAFSWIEGGGLTAFLQKDEALSDLLAYDAGELTAHDPRLAYYLSILDWSYLAKRAGIDVVLSGGDLIFPAPRAGDAAWDRGQRTPENILDQPDYPWGNPRAVQLRNVFVGAYHHSIQTLTILARTSSILLARVEIDGAVEAVCNGILEAASRQGRLRELVSAVRTDPFVAAYWPAIDVCVPELGGGPSPPET